MKWLSLSGVLALSALLAASNPDQAARSEYLRARARLTDPSASAPADSALLRNYPLYPYLQAARLQARLVRGADDGATLDQDIATWLTAQGSAPVTVPLRRSWLASLAQRSQWRLFLAFYAPESADALLRCQWLNALLAEQGALSAEAVQAVWATAERLPAACNAPFAWARAQQVLSTEAWVARTQLALTAGNVALARDLIAALPVEAAGALAQWANLLATPVASVDQWLQNPQREIAAPILLAGWQRLVRTDLDAALSRLPKIVAAQRWTAAQASPFARELALALSWSRRPEALRYFAQVRPEDMTDSAYEWQARAALWAGDWPQVAQTITAMPAALQAQARWRYWLARAQQQRGDTRAAEAGWRALVDSQDNYYAALAAAQLAQPYRPHPQPLAVEPVALTRVAQLPALQRAMELVAVEQRDDADREWRSVYSGLVVAEKVAAARWAHDNGWYDQAIAALAKLNLFDDYALLYPRPYAAAVSAAAERSGLPAELIYAVMRQETLFRPDARSGADARGLLQLLPLTAQQVARRERLPKPSAEDLYRPDINVPLGAVYLESLIAQFDGRLPLGIAAYNAGPSAVRRWLPATAQPSDIWIENIPYNETRTYVQRILWHRLVFDWLRSGEPVITQPWLTQVSP